MLYTACVCACALVCVWSVIVTQSHMKLEATDQITKQTKERATISCVCPTSWTQHVVGKSNKYESSEYLTRQTNTLFIKGPHATREHSQVNFCRDLPHLFLLEGTHVRTENTTPTSGVAGELQNVQP